MSLGAITGLQGVAQGDLSLAGSPATATILNDDFPRLELTAKTASQLEGSSGGTTEFVFEVKLSESVADEDGFDVAYVTRDGTATLVSGDYLDNDGTLHFDGTAGQNEVDSRAGQP